MIQIYSKEEIEILREGGVILFRVLNTLKDKTVEGVDTFTLNQVALDLCKEYKAEPAFLNYKPHGAPRPFPGALCISINDEIVHGIPNEQNKVLKDGDVVVLDMGIKYKGMFTDSAITVVVGGDDKNPTGAKMIEAATQALYNAIDIIKPGVRTGTVGHTIEQTVKNAGTSGKKFSIPYELGGHGIGKTIHEDPFMPNFGKKGEGPILREGMVLAIEPILTEKKPQMKVLKDGYTYVTTDKGLSVHVEHTVVVTKDGCEILTRE